MGKALDFFFVFNWTFNFADLISLFGIIINSALAIWIVKTIQNKLANKRVLKDHFIAELKDLRIEYLDFIKVIHEGNLLPKLALRKFKSLEIKKKHLFENLLEIYNIDAERLDNFHFELRELITNSTEYSRNFRTNNPVIFTPQTIRTLDRIQMNYDGTFNSLIIKINDSD